MKQVLKLSCFPITCRCLVQNSFFNTKYNFPILTKKKYYKPENRSLEGKIWNSLLFCSWLGCAKRSGRLGLRSSEFILWQPWIRSDSDTGLSFFDWSANQGDYITTIMLERILKFIFSIGINMFHRIGPSFREYHSEIGGWSVVVPAWKWQPIYAVLQHTKTTGAFFIWLDKYFHILIVFKN